MWKITNLGKLRQPLAVKILSHLAATVSEIQCIVSVLLCKYWPLAAAAFENQMFTGRNVFTMTLFGLLSFFW